MLLMPSVSSTTDSHAADRASELGVPHALPALELTDARDVLLRLQVGDELAQERAALGKAVERLQDEQASSLATLLLVARSVTPSYCTPLETV